MKLQSAKETQSPAAPPSDTDDMRKNDLAIRDCCLFFADQNRGYGALLVSMDKILCLECQKEGSFAACPRHCRTISLPSAPWAQARTLTL